MERPLVPDRKRRATDDDDECNSDGSGKHVGSLARVRGYPNAINIKSRSTLVRKDETVSS